MLNYKHNLLTNIHISINHFKLKTMKKILTFILLSLFTISVNAETEYIKAIKFAIYNQDTEEWTDYNKCDLDIAIDYDNDLVTINSSKKQIYKIVSSEENQYDYMYTAYNFTVVDSNLKKCRLIFKVNKSTGYISRLYIIYNNYSWVYVIE